MSEGRPSRGPSVAAAALAAAAEAGVWFFPARYLSGLLGGSMDASVGDLLWFVAAFTALAAAATALAGWPGVGAVLFVAALAAGFAEGRGLETAQPGGYLVAGLVAAGLALRVGSLAVRDWREPVQLSFGLGAVALLVEIVGSGFAGRAGGPLVAAVVPAFFLGSLASRAASVRLSEGWGPGDARRATTAIAAVGGAMGIAAAFGGAGGLFHRLGSLAAPVLGAVLGGFLWLFSQAARPFFWLMARFDLDFSRLQRALEGFREDVARRTEETQPPEAGLLERALGLFVVVALVVAVLYAFRRLRARTAPARAMGARDVVAAEGVTALAPGVPRPPSLPRLRRRVPAETVRRWYAEALLRLEDLRLSRDPARTPGEFRGDVRAAFPKAAPAFAALTAAYERVRYGADVPDRAALGSLRAERARLRAALRDARPIEQA